MSWVPPKWPEKIRAHILHVPNVDPIRTEAVERLKGETDACVHLDPERKGLMWNWLGALECAMDDTQPWALILQDDMEPLIGWDEHLRAACHYAPEPQLGLTYFGGWGGGALRKGVPYVVGNNVINGGAVAHHASLVGDLWEWAKRAHERTGYPSTDRMIAAFAKAHRMKTALVSRALFDVAVTKSLLGHNSPIRRPSYTINNCEGPFYGSKPPAVELKAHWDEKMDELVRT